MNVRDPLAGSTWSAAGTVGGFARAAPNAQLMRFAGLEAERVPRGRALDVGCGAGRNAVPLAAAGWHVMGLDLSWPMLVAASGRAVEAGVEARSRWALAPMDRIPVADRSVDLVVAHGIWNLASSVDQFRRAVDEAARVSRPGAGLFVFTFSRHTLPADLAPVPGQPFVFTEFSGSPQVFLTQDQLVSEMARAGFSPDPAVRMSEYNRRSCPARALAGPPVIHEAAFRLG